MKEAFNAVLERIKSPIYSFFIATWMIINWKIVFIAFSFSYTTTIKLYYIGEELVNTTNTIYWPLTMTGLYFLGYKWIEVLNQWYQLFIKEVKNWMDLK